MSENIIGSRIASFIVLAHYNKLIDLSLGNMENTEEFKKEVSEVKRLFVAEKKEYNRVTDWELDNYFKSFTDDKLKNLLDAREYNKLKEKKRLNEGYLNANGVLISSIISGKLFIDIIKDTQDTINRLLYEGKIDEGDLYILNLYCRRYKFHYFTANNFIEELAIQKEFNLDKIEKIDFGDIEEAFNIKFIDKSQNIFYEYVMAAINDLGNLDMEDIHEQTFLSMLNVAKVKSLLPYLNIDILNKISEMINDGSSKYERNSALTKVKKLINKRKEESK